LEQSARDAAPHEVAMLLHRSNHKRWKLTLYADDLVRFLKAAKALLDRAEVSELIQSHPEG
ncbi:MAG: hypothetical protein NTY53_21600, partial [Kiritimatiellaeota bacterium]|nr:hypothetical protein [Kiritimatiellota bacterium]